MTYFVGERRILLWSLCK